MTQLEMAPAWDKVFPPVPGTSHTDLYDQMDIMPFDAIQNFFEKNLKA